MNVNIQPLIQELYQLMRLTFDTESYSLDYARFGDQIMSAFGYVPSNHIVKYKEYEIDFRDHNIPSYIKYIWDETLKIYGKDIPDYVGSIQFYYIKYDGDEEQSQDFYDFENKVVYMIDKNGESSFCVENEENDLYDLDQGYVMVTKDPTTFNYHKGEYRFIIVDLKEE
jgi:hypothetical protein